MSREGLKELLRELVASWPHRRKQIDGLKSISECMPACHRCQIEALLDAPPASQPLRGGQAHADVLRAASQSGLSEAEARVIKAAKGWANAGIGTTEGECELLDAVRALALAGTQPEPTYIPQNHPGAGTYNHAPAQMVSGPAAQPAAAPAEPAGPYVLEWPEGDVIVFSTVEDRKKCEVMIATLRRVNRLEGVKAGIEAAAQMVSEHSEWDANSYIASNVRGLDIAAIAEKVERGSVSEGG